MRLPVIGSSSFRVQIGVVFAVFCMALIIVISLVFSRMMGTSIQVDAGNSLHVVANNSARILAEGLHQRLVIATTLAKWDRLWSGGLSSPSISDELSEEQAIRPNLAWLGIADARGIVRSATGNLLVGQSVAERPWFKAGLKGPHVSDVHSAALLSKLLPKSRGGEPQRFVDFAAPIVVKGKVVGVIGIHGSWDWTQYLIDSLMPRNYAELGLEVFIFDKAGVMIYAPHEGRLDRNPKLGPRIIAENNKAGQTASVITWGDGVDYLTSIAPLVPKETETDLGWYIVARQPTRIAFARKHEATLRVMSADLFIGVIASILAFAMAGTLSRPLRQICKAADRIRNGDHDAKLPMFHNNDELTSLSEALASMTQALQESKVNLEHVVDERTAELMEANAHLEDLARKDPLTELLNRRGFNEQSQYVVSMGRRRQSPTSVLMIDIDHFKKINDTFGHPTGDVVLKKLAKLIRTTVRETDLVARVGGEEFIVLLPDTPLDGARQVADHLVKSVSSADLLAEWPVTISCGVALHGDADDGFEAVKRADKALYEAKRHGRNQAWTIDSMVDRAAANATSRRAVA